MKQYYSIMIKRLSKFRILFLNIFTDSTKKWIFFVVLSNLALIIFSSSITNNLNGSIIIIYPFLYGYTYGYFLNLKKGRRICKALIDGLYFEIIGFLSLALTIITSPVIIYFYELLNKGRIDTYGFIFLFYFYLFIQIYMFKNLNIKFTIIIFFPIVFLLIIFILLLSFFDNLNQTVIIFFLNFEIILLNIYFYFKFRQLI